MFNNDNGFYSTISIYKHWKPNGWSWKWYNELVCDRLVTYLKALS